MATQADVRRLSKALPDVVEDDDHYGFSVKSGAKVKRFAWAWRERVHPKKPRVVNPAVLGIRVEDLGEKELLIASDPDKFFTEPHYNGYPAVLVRLEAVDAKELKELLTDAWFCMAPPATAKEYQKRLGDA
jgi:hypothetical protein